MELIERKFYKGISEYAVDLDTLFSFSTWLQKNGDPRARLISLELALEYGRDIDELGPEFKGYKIYKSPVDLSNGKSMESAYQELEIIHEENKRRVLDIPNELSKEISLEWNYGYISQIFVQNQQALSSLSEFINPRHLKSVTSLFLHNITSLDLPAWVNELPCLNGFGISCKDVKQITKPFRNIEKLIDLDIGDNQLTDVPNWVGDLHQLDTLDLSGNELTSIPGNLHNLDHLTTLWLGANNFTEIPEVLEKLILLERLYLGGNQITELPAWIINLTKLSFIQLSNNCLTVNANWIDGLKIQGSLKLNSSKRTEISESICNLALDLSHNKLIKLPDNIGKLSRLSKINLSHNKLIELPDSIGNLSQLTAIDLSYNKLTELPVSIGNLLQLTHIDLSFNKLTILPASFEQLQNMKYFTCRGRFIKNFPKNLSDTETEMPSHWERLILTFVILGFIALAILLYNL